MMFSTYTTKVSEATQKKLIIGALFGGGCLDLKAFIA